MTKNIRYWPLQFYIYIRRRGLSHRLRLRITHISEEDKKRVLFTELQMRSQQFGVYQRIWFLPLYIYRADIRGVYLDQEFFYGLPTSRCLLSLGCRFVLIERTQTIPPIINGLSLKYH